MSKNVLSKSCAPIRVSVLKYLHRPQSEDRSLGLLSPLSKDSFLCFTSRIQHFGRRTKSAKV